jgi:glucosamine 6-phosphate synthetase-like amidotransferase/phosphosugar isomerase protein
MCGIAGFSLASKSSLDRTLAAQSLLAAIAERGADAVGYAYRTPSGPDATIVKQRTPASKLLDRVTLPTDARELLVHVRDYTKGHPSVAANNHPVIHGPVVGVHNGIIVNDDDLLADQECARVEPGMTVDSEAIFAVAAHSRNHPRALEALRGAMAAAWFDWRDPDLVFLARGVGRPLWLGEGRDTVMFASTETALGIVERFCDIELRKRELPQGTFVVLERGRVRRTREFATHTYVEDAPRPSVRAPREREFCLSRLAAIAAAA